MEAEDEKSAFFGWRYRHCFDFISFKAKNIAVRCRLCVGNKTLSTAKNSMSNLLKHLKGQHSTLKYEKKARATADEPRVSQGPPAKRQKRFFFRHLYSSGLFCRESPQFDDLFGFSAKDVLEELQRGRKLRCSKCKKKGATVGCETKRCKKSYHYPCAIEAGAETFEDKENGQFGLYCLRCNNKKLGLLDDDSTSSSASTHNPKRKLDFGDCQEEKRAHKHSRRIESDDSDSDATDAGEETDMLAPLESDLEENADSQPNELLHGKHDLVAPGTSSDIQMANQCKAENNGASVEPTDANSGQSLLLPVEATDISMDSSNFWRDCVSAGCTQAIFSDFIREMTDIFTRITSGQASNEDYDVAFKVMRASGKLEGLVAKQQKDYQKKLTELQQAAAALNRVASFLGR